MSNSVDPSASTSSSSSSSAAVNSPLEEEDDAGEVVQYCCDADTWISNHALQSSPSDEHTITTLIDSEPHFMPVSDYLHRCRDRSIDITARQDSINWILKVHAYHRFCPVTASLTVNYFDRFLSSHSLPGNGWPFQLLSVACLSLAAKMEEPHVPLLLDLQVLEPGFIFEPRTVQRMELRVMANLKWRLRSVTAFDYLHYFISKLPSSSTTSSSPSHDSNQLFKASSDLILSTTRVIDFLGFLPSTVAAAAVLCAAGGRSGEVSAQAEADGQFFHESVNKVVNSCLGLDSNFVIFLFEMVKSCHQLMEEYMVDTCPSARLKDLTAEQMAAPPSPVGVLDAAAACGSCDTRSDNPGPTSQTSPGPHAKRLRPSAPDVQPP
ncbi:hypothetical protein Tsubulata_004271 [Turnera subulata]|uniref:B-like cyclin n=1 Tax=Turnera subulata TaxID=218843 RepID=A0A9Q0F437_9ROSI|nr:hypothetical protein Tsubulata_004271 [Turnera subulata]